MLTFSHLNADSFESHLKAGRKRPRVREAVSCWQCRTRKIRCDRELPCKQCQDRGVPHDCVYGFSKDQHLSPQPPASRVSKRSTPASSRHNSPASSRPNTPSLSRQNSPQPPPIQIHTPPDSSSSRGETPEPASGIEIREPPFSSIGNAFQGSTFKTRMVGLSHWMAPCNEMTVVKAMLDHSDEFQTSRKSFGELKSLLRARNAIPAPMPSGMSESSSLQSLLPPRHECEGWMAQYRRTYGRIYRVLEPDVMASEFDRICAGTLDNPVHICKILLVTAIAMQNDESERLHGRRIARQVEDCIHNSPRFQKPCVGVVQVLLLLAIMKTISASDNDKIYEAMALQGLTSQIISSMGLHKNPAYFSEVTPYYAEIRKRLWSCFLRLNLEYCVRSGTQCNLRLKESDCPLPTLTNLRALNPDLAAQGYELESDKQMEADLAFGIASAKLARIVAPVYQDLYSPNPKTTRLQSEIRASFGSLLAELPAGLKPGAQTFDPVEEVQQSLISIPMHSFLTILSFGKAASDPADSSQRSHLMEIWDDATSVLHQFEKICSTSQDTTNMACHLLWTDAGRAALTSCFIIGRLRRLDLRRIIPHPQHTSCVFQQLLTKALLFLTQLCQSRFHQGPVAAKMNLILAVSLDVTSNLSSPNHSSPSTQQRLVEQGVATAERLIAAMKLTLQPQCQQPPPIPADLVTTPSSVMPSPGSSMFSAWPAERMTFLGHSETSSSAGSTPFLGHDFMPLDFPTDVSFSSFMSNFSFPTDPTGGMGLDDPTLAPFDDSPMESLWE
ncbi:hypothetical protein B0T24DRAFT_625781 [Lasiosphaeria ovina]|uniref:Zn(2)-C6 fungal-type domain-containing protein n=1 Tax=Lasiosphaeria ovina TaxID=92902 RepID=A0AAE0KDX1_9PEZI|nr:hypothetical protein B0T24DRAFT_625781 [Lasiosphaeria ovina]